MKTCKFKKDKTEGLHICSLAELRHIISSQPGNPLILPKFPKNWGKLRVVPNNKVKQQSVFGNF